MVVEITDGNAPSRTPSENFYNPSDYRATLIAHSTLAQGGHRNHQSSVSAAGCPDQLVPPCPAGLARGGSRCALFSLGCS